ncbi:MAG: hypothetical protein HY520_03075 [Candidatus Aenigmarchaeota archaeon]|nr:hypothetical protein [Candidatus Aenigmarchaeota archaeon]
MPRVDQVSYGEIVLDGKTYYSDMVVWWDGKADYLEKLHLLGFGLLLKLLKREPQAIVIGTGMQGSVKILPEFTQKAEEKGVKLFVDRTENATDIFNGLIARNKRAVAVLHVTL